MNVSPTPEPSRKYIQWKEENVGLLLTDLKQPGQYGKWRENKSAYSKRAAEQIFNNSVNHETIKFKIRWLESRFQRWHEQMTVPNADEKAIRDKMTKEFPYYDRCKKVFDLQSKQSIIIHEKAPATFIEHSAMKPEPIPPAINNSEPNNTLPLAIIENHNKRNCTQDIPPSSAASNKKLKAIDNNMIPDNQLKIMEMELEYKKMDHQERMQEMKLEQLRLEIELQKLKRDQTTM